MGDSNNNRTTTVVQATSKSSDAHFDITSLISKQAHDSSIPLRQQNKEANLKYPNFWPTPTIQQHISTTGKSQQPSFTLIPETMSNPITSKTINGYSPNDSGKSMESTLQNISPVELANDGIEWVRIVKTPPPSSATSDVSDDEFIIRCLTAESNGSSSSSIRWADDAVESEWTEKLQKQWDEIEKVCSLIDLKRPPEMSQIVYNECLEWRRAFRCEENPRFLWPKCQQQSPTPESSRDLISPRSSTPFDDSQDYVHTWLTQCQENSTGFSSLPIQSAKTKDVIRVLGEKGQGEEIPRQNYRRIENRSPPASLLEYRTRIKVQRPISSHVRGHTITPISTGLISNRRTSKDHSLLAMIDEQQLSISTYPKSPTESHIIWSRHDHHVIQEDSQLESFKPEVIHSRDLSENPNRDKTSKSFINWLFYDDNIEPS